MHVIDPIEKTNNAKKQAVVNTHLNKNNMSRLLYYFSRIRKVLNVTCILVFTSFIFTTSVYALDENTDESKYQVRKNSVKSGSLLFKTDKPGKYVLAPQVKTDVKIKITGLIARTTVTQTFTNKSDSWVEGIYVFPLPDNSAVDHMDMKIGKRLIKGIIKERKEAKKIYVQAKKAGKKAALIEQERPNLFTNSVANIGPKETIQIRIEYQQSLRYDQGQFRLRFPMAITPRFSPGKPINNGITTAVYNKESVSNFTVSGWAYNTNQVPDATRISPDYNVSESKINPVTLQIRLDAGLPLRKLQSSYHRITRTNLSGNKVLIRFADDKVYADHDFELVWAPKLGTEPKAALFTEIKENKRYHYMMIMPPAPVANNKALAREVIYIVDTSGSMGGTSIVQARKALVLALDRLKPHDRFNVIQFNSITSKLFSDARLATSDNLNQARTYVRNLYATGGTNMEPALTAALDPNMETNQLRQVIFLTDGSVGNERALFTLIKQRLGTSRLFTIGIGSAPNSFFMKKAAKFGRGTFTYIGDVNEIQEKMNALFSKLESPVMTNFTVEFNKSMDIEILPKRIPDLYKGEPVIITIKADKDVDEIKVKAKRGAQHWNIKMSLKGGQKNNGVAVLFARRKISSLMDSIHGGADKQEVEKSVIQVALTHHLVSKFTSLVAVDVTPTRPNSETLKKTKVPSNLPNGQKANKIFASLAQGATTWQMNLIIALLCLLSLFLLKVTGFGSKLKK